MDQPFDLQIICSTPGDVARATRGGATRIEISGCYTAGGVTPSPGIIRHCIKSTDLPVTVAMRPREGHLVYTASEREIILEDAEWSLAEGAATVLIGGLDGHLNLDFDLIETAIERFGGQHVMVNRAIDSVRKPEQAFERLKSLPIHALASSAGAGNAIKGHEKLLGWQAEADFDIFASGAVLPSGAARMWTAGLSCFRASARHSAGVAHEGRWFEGELYPVDARRVEHIVRSLQRAVSEESEEGQD
jgi:copper homeostasis protein CutC